MDPITGQQPTGEAPTPAQGEPTPQGDQTPAPPAEKMVPVSALVAERRRYAGQINSLSSQIAALTEKIEAGQQQRQPAGADDPQDAERKKVEKYYGIDVLKDQLSQVLEKIAALDQLKEQTEQLSQRFSRQENTRMDRAEKLAVKAFDASLGVTQETWDQWVASQMTGDDIEEIVSVGNVQHMNEVVKRAKAVLLRGSKPAAPPASLQRDLKIVSRLPATPAPGGNPPTPPAEEKLTGRALHNRAASRLQEVFSRHQAGG